MPDIDDRAQDFMASLLPRSRSLPNVNDFYESEPSRLYGRLRVVQLRSAVQRLDVTK